MECLVRTSKMAEKARQSNEAAVAIEEQRSAPDSILYKVDESPPWYLAVLLGFQHYLTAFGSTITVPLVLQTAMCIDQDRVGLSEIISTTFFVSGISTLLQTTLGVRLPIIQGVTFSFLTPTFTILALDKWKCPYVLAAKGEWNVTSFPLPDPGSPGHREIWQMRMREIQGTIMVSSVFQIIIGFSGIMGLILQFIGPLAIVPTISLIGLSLFKEAADLASKQWYIALMTMFLIALFSQYLRNISIPVCKITRKDGCSVYKLPIFKLFPILLALLTAWMICAILTATGALPEKEGWGYAARTDVNADVLKKALWFRFPYPGQWGMPTVSVSAVFGMLAGVLASMIESVGDYYACAKLAGAPPPPIHAVNRGIGIEGIGCLLAGAWGSGNGTTSYSENIGAIGITRVGSRRVVQIGGIVMIVLGCLGKFGALFVTIPDPVIGGLFMVTFGMVVAVGLSNLQFVDLTSSRNIFILGTSIFFGLSFPNWMKNHPGYISTDEIADQLLTVLLGTSMFVGGVVGFVLDNTIPGTLEERGIIKWRETDDSVKVGGTSNTSVYDLPFIQKYLNRLTITRFLPFCANFQPCSVTCKRENPTLEHYEQSVEDTKF
ncbi:solute carrier family 23 member 1-like isoform X2 [Ostrea edulis]|uniref:solute carrier family 23 member 1-like isoform X2 n=1 Tax=Ostrea edulis TaxID=37623 RepID=UPI002094E081|nr:solute carrier family 23 member 1-like isoform X2 [Ostrea edulis]